MSDYEQIELHEIHAGGVRVASFISRLAAERAMEAMRAAVDKQGGRFFGLTIARRTLDAIEVEGP